MDPEALYHHVGRLIESMPKQFPYPLSPEIHRWLGEADAVVNQSGDVRDTVEWRVAVGRLGTMYHDTTLEEMRRVLYRVLGSCELKAPPRAKGTFIPAGGSFDTFAAIAKILESARQEVFIVDPYMDESALTTFGTAVAEGVPLRLLADAKDCKASLAPAAERWNAQYGTNRPLAVRLAPPGALHDRAIFTDRTAAWTLTQSLKDFAKRSPGEIIRADDTAPRKIAAYEAIWQSAAVIV